MRVHQEQELAGDSDMSTENKAFSAELYQRYASRLLAYLCKHMPSLHDAEDILLDVFLKVLEYASELSKLPEEKQRAWLWTVARNRLIDDHRRKKRRPHVPLELLTDMADEGCTPEQAVLRGEEDEQLHRWIGKLSSQQQEVLAMRFTSGLRCTEIATILNKPDGTIRTILSRALNALRSMHHE